MRIRSGRGSFTAWHVVASGAVVALIGPDLKSYIVDDGLIYARFATCMATEANWAFNCEGPPVYATTSALWPIFIAALVFIGVEQTTSIPLMNGVAVLLLGSAAGYLFPAHRIDCRIFASASISALPLIWKSQGLEMVLAIALVAWSIVAFVRKSTSPRF